MVPDFVYRIRLIRRLDDRLVSNYWWFGPNPLVPAEDHARQMYDRANFWATATQTMRTVFDRAISYEGDAYATSPWHKVGETRSGYIPGGWNRGSVPFEPAHNWVSMCIDSVSPSVRNSRIFWPGIASVWLDETGHIMLAYWAIVQTLLITIFEPETWAVSVKHKRVAPHVLRLSQEVRPYSRRAKPLPTGQVLAEDLP